MKNLITVTALLLVTIIAQTSFAGLPGSIITNPPAPQEYNGLAQVKIEQKSTVTCMAIGCPPSELYYEVSLQLMNPVLGETVAIVETHMGVAPKNIGLGTITVRNGDMVEVSLTVSKTFKLDVLNINSIHHAPHRHGDVSVN